jgi:hypothetical protein
MERFSAGVVKRIADDTLPIVQENGSKVKKVPKVTLSPGLTSACVNGEERPRYVTCYKTPSVASKKPNKLKRHLQSHGPSKQTTLIFCS